MKKKIYHFNILLVSETQSGVVVYHGRTRRQAVGLLELMDLPDSDLGRYVPDFDQAFYDFSPDSEEEIKGAILLRLALTCLRAKNNPTVERHVREIFRMLRELGDDAPSLQWLTTIAGYVFQTMDIDRDVMHTIVRETLGPGKEETVMTIAERLRSEGRMQGQTEGEVLGRYAVLQRQLAKRFGLSILDLRTQERLRTATAGQLDLWAERILDARTIEDVFREY